MTEDMNKNEQGTPMPATPETPQVPVTPQPQPQPQPQQPPMPQQVPVQPMYQQAPPVYVPAPLTQLTGGMKFGWFVVGALLSVPGIVIAWLTNADKHPDVKNGAVKWSLIGFAVWIVLGFLFALLFTGMLMTAMAAAVGSMDPSYYGHGSW